MGTYFLKNEDLFRFYERISGDYELYVPAKTQTPLKVGCEYGFTLPTDDYFLKKYSEIDKEEIVFNEYRCFEPASRIFFSRIKEEVCGYFDEENGKSEKPIAVCGIKNCDIFSIKIQDFVFLGGSEKDPAYKARRENTLIISSDCPGFKESCFCRAFDINPHVNEGFDFNLTPLNNGFLVDAASKRAKDIADSLKEVLTKATLGQLSGRSVKRESVIRRMEEHLSYHRIPEKGELQDIVLSGYNSKVWNEQAQTCVECGGCVFACDTCHCFLLADEPEDANAKRMRVWDGCLLKNFSKVAGGANPLKRRYMRLRNRYLKKFDFFVGNMSHQACCGCGRCIEVCPGKIDIRNILRKLREEKSSFNKLIQGGKI